VIFDSIKSVSIPKFAKKNRRNLIETFFSPQCFGALSPTSLFSQNFFRPFALPASPNLFVGDSQTSKPPFLQLPSKFVSSSLFVNQINTYIFSKKIHYILGESVAYVTIALAEGRSCTVTSATTSTTTTSSTAKLL
jgi:hypothetical protein